MKNLRMILIVLGMMLFFPYSSQTFASGDEGDAVQGYEKVPHTCPLSGEETHRCEWNDAASCDVSGQIPC
jgi:hypothetical protein